MQRTCCDMHGYLKVYAWQLSRRMLNVIRKGITLLFNKAEYLAALVLFPVSYVIAHVYSAISGMPIRVYEKEAGSNLGGWVLALDAYLRAKNNEVKPSHKDIFLVNPKRTANPFFLHLMERKVCVATNGVIRFLLFPLAKLPNKFKLKDYVKYSESLMACMSLPSVTQWFSDADQIEGDLLLRKLGMIPGESWYVCFFSRDNGYNENASLKHEMAGYRKYHSCRNSDINTQIKAIEYIIAKGGYAIRMGKFVESKVAFKHPRFIDYPFSDYRSDFADIYLPSHCRFFVGDGSGLMNVAGMMNIPIAAINYVVYGGPNTADSKEYLLMPKLIKYAATGRYMTIKEYFELIATKTSWINIIKAMKDYGLIFEDNSEDDILMITEAVYRRVVEKSVTDEVWDSWKNGYSEALKINKYCNIWGPFIEKHRYLM